MLWLAHRRSLFYYGLLLCLLAAIAVFYQTTWAGLADVWRSDANTYSHGYLVALICLVLLFRRMPNVIGVVERRAYWLLPAFIVLASIWFVASIANILIVQAAIVPVLLLFALLSVFGCSSYRAWLFPVGYFYFAVPFWDYLNNLLQNATIVVTGKLLQFFAIPVFLQGSYVFLPAGTFEIASGCSGLHFVIVAASLSALYAHLYLHKPFWKLALIATALLAAILMNWVRVAVIIAVGHASDMTHYLVTIDHYSFGWVLFAVMLVPLYFAAQMMEARDTRMPRSDEGAATVRVAAPSAAVAGRVAVVVCMLGLAPLAVFALERLGDQASRKPFELPDKIGTWTMQVGPRQAWEAHYTGADIEVSGTYSRNADGSPIHIYANRYSIQAQGAELINATNAPFDPAIWTVRSSSTVNIDLQGVGRLPLQAREVVAANGAVTLIVFWYAVDGAIVVNPAWVKMLEFLGVLQGNPSSGVIAVIASCVSNCNPQRIMVERFVGHHAATITRLLWSDSTEVKSDDGLQESGPAP